MSKTQLLPVVLVFIGLLGGCESSDSAQRIAKLQEQIARVAQQLSETQRQVDGLQEANQQSVKALDDLTATVERLQSGAPMPVIGKAAKQPQGQAREVLAAQANVSTVTRAGETSSREDGELTGETLGGRDPGAAMVAISCSQVWKLIGQGKTPESAARVLGVSVTAIRACEQKVGRSSASR